jgi:hypothetical protein
VTSESYESLRDRLEGDLAKHAETCIAAVESWSERFPPSQVTLEPLGELASALEYFAGRALLHDERWGEDWWADGFWVDAASAPAKRKLVVHGRLIWAEGDQGVFGLGSFDEALGKFHAPGCRIDPVLVTLDLAATLPQIASYEVAFGDAEKGIGQLRWTESSALEWSDLKAWLITVRGSGYPEF